MPNTKFVVIGDTILDCFLYGDAVRISPEAPALVLDVRDERQSVGGAFNVFAHLSSLGSPAKLISVAGSDIERYKPDYPDLTAFENDVTILKDPGRITSVKTRLVALYKLSYLARFDKELVKDIADEYAEQILKAVSVAVESKSCVLIVDYRKGVITPSLAKDLIRLCRARNVRVFVDSKKDDISCFAGSYLFKPNKFEFHEIKLRYQLSQLDDIEACKRLMKMFDIGNIVLTLGARGMIAVDQTGQVFSVAGHDVMIKELSGAGDSVLAVLATVLEDGYSLDRALKAANNVAASFISSGVTYRAKRSDLFGSDNQ